MITVLLGIRLVLTSLVPVPSSRNCQIEQEPMTIKDLCRGPKRVEKIG